MRLLTKRNRPLALIFALFLAVFSTGNVIAHQFHSESSDQVAMQQHHSNVDSGSTVATKPQNVLSKPLNISSDTGHIIYRSCAALFIFALLFGRRLVNLRAVRSRLESLLNLSWKLVLVNHPQVFHLALTRPQLGVIRI